VRASRLTGREPLSELMRRVWPGLAAGENGGLEAEGEGAKAGEWGWEDGCEEGEGEGDRAGSATP
jgi:hypothetical protein